MLWIFVLVITTSALETTTESATTDVTTTVTTDVTTVTTDVTTAVTTDVTTTVITDVTTTPAATTQGKCSCSLRARPSSNSQNSFAPSHNIYRSFIIVVHQDLQAIDTVFGFPFISFPFGLPEIISSFFEPTKQLS